MGRLSSTLRRTALAYGAPVDWNRRRSYDWSTFSDRSVFHRLGSSAYSPKGPVTHSEKSQLIANIDDTVVFEVKRVVSGLTSLVVLTLSNE